MADPYLGEIRLVGFNYAPVNWAFCNGQLLQISSNTALFSLLGVMYGGDGIRTFGLPNLQSRFPIGMGQGGGLSPYQQGQAAGAESVTLTTLQLPRHTHGVSASSQAATQSSASGNLLPSNSGKTAASLYTPASAGAPVTMDPSMIQPSGSSAPVPTLPPYLALNFIIALQGIYPPRS